MVSELVIAWPTLVLNSELLCDDVLSGAVVITLVPDVVAQLVVVVPTAAIMGDLAL
jgi:hypothetical protein